MAVSKTIKKNSDLLVSYPFSISSEWRLQRRVRWRGLPVVAHGWGGVAIHGAPRAQRPRHTHGEDSPATARKGEGLPVATQAGQGLVDL